MKQLTGIDVDWLSNKSVRYNRTTYNKHESSSQNMGQSGLNVRYIWAGRLENKSVDLYLRELGKARIHYGPVNTSLIHVAGFAIWTISECQEQNVSLAKCLSLYER